MGISTDFSRKYVTNIIYAKDSLLTNLYYMSVKLIRTSFASILIQVFGLSLSLITAIFLARKLGPENYGIYTYVVSIFSILAIPATFGLPTLLVRETAKAEVKKDWGVIKGLWYWGNCIALFLSAIIVFFVALFLFFFRNNLSYFELQTFIWGLVFLPISAMAALRAASLRGLRKVIQGQLPEQVLKPGFFICFLAFFWVFEKNEINAGSAMMLNALSAGFAFLCGAWILKKEKPKQMINANKKFDAKAWSKSLGPLAALSGLSIVITQSGIIVSGIFLNPSDIAVYKVAMQGADLAALGIAAANMVSMPHMSKYANSSDFKELRKITQANARLSFAVSAVITLILFIFGRYFIEITFGVNYIDAYWLLILIALSQMIHAGFGPGGTLLNMCGREKGTLITLIFSGILNVILNFLLIPILGIYGAAISMLVSVLFRKVVVWIMVYLILNIDSSMLGLDFKRFSNQS